MPILKPTFIAARVESITPDFCQQHHISAAAFDVDGTLTEYHAREVEPSVERTLQRLGSAGIRLFIVSNAYGDRTGELEDIYTPYGMTVLTPADCTPEGVDPHRYRKPSPAMINRVLELAAVPLEDLLVVGDQILKDVVSATRAGDGDSHARSLLVARRGRADHPAVKYLQRPLESAIRLAHSMPARASDFPEEIVEL